MIDQYVQEKIHVVTKEIFKIITLPEGKDHLTEKIRFLQNFALFQQEAFDLYEKFEKLEMLDFIASTNKTIDINVFYITLLYCKEIHSRNAATGGDKKSEKYDQPKKFVENQWNFHSKNYRSKSAFASDMVLKIKEEFKGLEVQKRTIETNWLPKGDFRKTR